MTDPQTARIPAHADEDHDDRPARADDRRALLAGIGGLAAGALLASTRTAHAGPLNPPAGPIVSTGKTLSEVEPRIAVNSTNTPASPRALFTISEPGSYYLTGNVTADPSRPFAIAILAPRVTLDLNGFTIDANTVGGIGINGGNTTAPLVQHGITIRNGSIRNFSTFGVVHVTEPWAFPDGLAPATSIDSLRLTGRTGDNPGTGQGIGIRLGRDAIIRNSTVNYTSIGIQTGFNAIVLDCSVFAAASGAYVIGASSTVSNCIAVGTFGASGAPVVGAGFFVGSGSAVSRCIARTNQSVGFILENATSLIDCSATDNTTGGIEARGNCLISRALVAQGQTGIRLINGGNRLENSKIGNAVNAIVSAGIDTIVDNTMNSATFQGGVGIRLESTDNVVEGNTLYGFGVGISIAIANSFSVVARNRFNVNAVSIGGPGAAAGGVAPVINSLAGSPSPYVNISL